MTHTPGPWEVGSRGGMLGREVRAGATYVVATVNSTNNDEGNRQANARLIAAAPELLALAWTVAKAMEGAVSRAAWAMAEAARAATRGAAEAASVAAGAASEARAAGAPPDFKGLLQALGVR